jgi:hypothetical protein
LELFLLRIYNVSQIGFDFGLFSQKRCVGTFIVSVRNDRKRETTMLKICLTATNTIVENGQFATASVYGLQERKAIYR